MERIVLYLCGLWFWLTRKFRIDSYSEAAEILQAAREHLAQDFAGRASTRDRGGLLPEQAEALAILDRQGSFARRTTARLDSLSECCRFVFEELADAAPDPQPQLETARTMLSGDTMRTALVRLLPDTRTGEVRIISATPSAQAEPVQLPEAA